MNPPPVAGPPHAHHTGVPCPRPGALHAGAGVLALAAVLGACGSPVSGVAVARPAEADQSIPQLAATPCALHLPPPGSGPVPVYRPTRWP